MAIAWHTITLNTNKPQSSVCKNTVSLLLLILTLTLTVRCYNLRHGCSRLAWNINSYSAHRCLSATCLLLQQSGTAMSVSQLPACTSPRACGGGRHSVRCIWTAADKHGGSLHQQLINELTGSLMKPIINSLMRRINKHWNGSKADTPSLTTRSLMDGKRHWPAISLQTSLASLKCIFYREGLLADSF